MMLHKQEQGVALFVALIILLIVSLMGVSAMRGGILSERMAFNTQARELSFQAAETAINGVIATARESDDLLNDLVGSGATRTHCVTRSQRIADGACATGGTFDARFALYGQAESTYEHQRNAFGSDASVIVDYQFHTVGHGGFSDQDTMPFINHNYQQWRRLGAAAGPFELPDMSLVEVNEPNG